MTRLQGSVFAICLVAVAVPVQVLAQDTPVRIEGRGQTATEAFYLPAPQSVAWFSHAGSRNFIVTAYIGDRRELLVNTIGLYSGYRPIITSEPVTLDIQADGAWSVQIEPIIDSGEPSFIGSGDAVSGWFSPPRSGPWDISHDGQRNFIVTAHCAGGNTLVQNQIGAVSASRVVNFRQGPCFWEVRADGSWSLAPR